jgi:hypothetical protein
MKVQILCKSLYTAHVEKPVESLGWMRFCLELSAVYALCLGRGASVTD